MHDHGMAEQLLRKAKMSPLLVVLASICLCSVPSLAFHHVPSTSLSGTHDVLTKRPRLEKDSHLVSLQSSQKDYSHFLPLQSSRLGTRIRKQSSLQSSSSNNIDTSSIAYPSSKTPLSVAIVGAGPSGLLLAHRLLSSNNIDAKVSIFEMRPDYRKSTIASGSSRAYALGLGPRARYAIKSVDTELWDEVSSRGFPCDRFTLHVTPKIKLRLRDGVKKLPKKFGAASYAKFEDQDDKDPPSLEPSILIYQTDLCAALVDGLIKRHGGDDEKLTLNFETRVSGADANDGYLSVQTEKFGTEQIIGPFDFVAGCGGVNSPVRDAIASAAPKNTFTAETRNLPGEFKVARLPSMPPLLDPKSVALILPSKPKKDKTKSKDDQTDTKGRGNTMSAFVEPVVDGGACILFAGRGGGDADEESAHEHRKESLLSDWRLESFDRSDIDSFAEDIISRFPLLEGTPKKDIQSMIQQLVSQRPGVAAAVKCNAFHYGKAALCGDAAHATGGVSGQGVNSALIDSVVLAECIDQQFANIGEDSDYGNALSTALLAYSQRQVPEGLALYDLSFGPEGELGLLGRLRVLLSTVRDTIFGGRLGIGRPLLQVQLSSSTRQFADIRRDRTEYYGEKFPDAETFNRTLEKLYDV